MTTLPFLIGTLYAQLLQHCSPFQASCPSRTRNHTIPSEAAASTHQAPISSWAKSAATTTRESQPHVMLSTASARNARLPSASARRSLRRDGMYMIGIANTVMTRPGRENSAPCCVHNFHAAEATTYMASANSKTPLVRAAVCSAFSAKARPCRSFDC